MDSRPDCARNWITRNRTSLNSVNSREKLCQYGRKRNRTAIDGSALGTNCMTKKSIYCRNYDVHNRSYRRPGKTHMSGIVYHPRHYRQRKIGWMLLYAVISSCLLISCDAKRQPKGAPPQLQRARLRVTATVGQPHLVLKCGVKSANPPLIKWKYKGMSIPLGHSRFRETSQRHLRIKNVKAEDAGKYICTATNLYGQVEQQINLVVNDDRRRTALSKPRFTMPSRMRRKRLTKPSNSMLKLRCAAIGHPTPQIEWYKNGNLTQPPGSGRRPAWIFKIKKLQQHDSGTYKCKVWNTQGAIDYTYEVHVVGQFSKKPVVLSPHPMNTTVQVGGMTAIQCRVQSAVRPTVKWIKKIEEKDFTDAENNLPGNLITIEGSHFLILPTQEMLDLPNETYLNKLVIRGATETHAGMYICLAANTKGYNFRYAYLTVVPGPLNSSGSATSPRTIHLPPSRNRNSRSSSYLPVMIGVPAGIGLLVVLLVACICQKNKARRFHDSAAKNGVQRSTRLSAFGSSETKSSTQSTPLPQEYDQGLGTEQWNKEQQLAEESENPLLSRTSNYYVYNHRHPPTVGTPLLTVEEPDGSEGKSRVTDGDTYCTVPVAPPCSEVTSPCSTERLLGFNPPPPSQNSATSLSSYHYMRDPHLHHYHYMHPPGNSRRHHNHRNHHPRRGHHHYGH